MAVTGRLPSRTCSSPASPPRSASSRPRYSAAASGRIGFYGIKTSFWPLPSTFLSGTAAAAIAAINSLGNLGGLIGPNLVGWLKDSTGSFEAGLYAMAGCALISAIVTLIAVRAPRRRVEPTGLGVAAA